jgi:hypothetical protein
VKRVFAAALSLSLVAVGAVCAREASSATAPYTISDVRAQLFYSDRGTFSGDVLADTTIALWNTVIGEGGAGGASSSTLVVVEVAGEPGSYEPERAVELVATADGKELLRQSAELSVLNAEGKTYVAFWLPKTGCDAVRLSARLTGQPQPSARTAEIPFACGE